MQHWQSRAAAPVLISEFLGNGVELLWVFSTIVVSEVRSVTWLTIWANSVAPRSLNYQLATVFLWQWSFVNSNKVWHSCLIQNPRWLITCPHHEMEQCIACSQHFFFRTIFECARHCPISKVGVSTAMQTLRKAHLTKGSLCSPVAGIKISCRR